MSAEGPTDVEIKQAITSALEKWSASDTVRPNKLRKIACRQTGATWTQFKECLDRMIERGDLRAREDAGGEMVVIVDHSANVRGPGSENQAEKCRAATKQMTRTITVPLAVAHRLKRKGRQKQKNIELATKTRLDFSMNGKTEKAASETGDQSVSLAISKELTVSDGDAEAKAEQQVNAAEVLIQSMVKAYEKHPERFAVKKAGGSLKEQEEARKRREEALKFRAKRHHKHGGEDSGGRQKTYGGVTQPPSTKKKRRKFY